MGQGGLLWKVEKEVSCIRKGQECWGRRNGCITKGNFRPSTYFGFNMFNSIGQPTEEDYLVVWGLVLG